VSAENIGCFPFVSPLFACLSPLKHQLKEKATPSNCGAPVAASNLRAEKSMLLVCSWQCAYKQTPAVFIWVPQQATMQVFGVNASV
jgi:hypothetical protein